MLKFYIYFLQINVKAFTFSLVNNLIYSFKRNFMKKATLIRDYSKLSDAKLNLKAEDIKLALTGNANFPVTDPTLTVFSASSEEFTVALTNAAQRGKVAIAEKNEKRANLLSMMNALAINITALADGSKVKLLSSGFDLAIETPSRSQLAAPTNFILTDGPNSGDLKLSIKAVKDARSYNYELTPEPLTADSLWSTKGSSSSEFVFTNMEVGKRMFCKVTAIGTRGQVMSTNILSRIVQ